MTRRAIEVVHVGSASRDLTPDDPRGWRLGGGVTYAALTTARLGLRTAALIGVDEAGADRRRARPAARGRRGPRPGSPRRGAGLRQPGDAGRARPDLPRGRPSGPVRGTCRRRGARRKAGRSCPVAGEIDDAWAAAIPATAYLALGWQGFLRDLAAGQRVVRRAPAPSALLRRADLVGVSHHDVASGTSLATLAGFLHPGADLLVTEGSQGGLLIRVGDDGPERDVAATCRRPRTARSIRPGPATRSSRRCSHPCCGRPSSDGARSRRSPDLRFAAAAGSLAVEGPGLAGVPGSRRGPRPAGAGAGPAGVVPSEASQVGTVDPS